VGTGRDSRLSVAYQDAFRGVSWMKEFLRLASVRSKLARLCFMLVTQAVELMRDLQIEGLPCELVTPVRSLMNARPP
jgi:hypothetical protein